MQCVAEIRDGVQCPNESVDQYRTVYPLPPLKDGVLFFVLTPLCSEHCPDGAIGAQDNESK